jgi:hypothetical protein
MAVDRAPVAMPDLKLQSPTLPELTMINLTRITGVMTDMGALRDTYTCRSSSAESAGRLWIVLPARLPRF